ncbi:hypothetical protein QF042_003356 [Pedobacter sp. W3I1]|nr:hypothetical protein [Pedobacter sp. W3I1]
MIKLTILKDPETSSGRRSHLNLNLNVLNSLMIKLTILKDPETSSGRRSLSKSTLRLNLTTLIS